MSFRLFERFGVELEYMVVDRTTLEVRPVVDALLQRALELPGANLGEDEDQTWPGSVEWDDVCWSNELTLHVLEFKTSEPAPSLRPLSSAFAAHVRRANALLASMNAMLLPTGMHPLMNPDREMVLWPHGYNDVYATFNRIFDCKGHGWANLQSCHLNLPFTGDSEPGDEFGRLHAAIRLLLPIMPALTASSPIKEGQLTGLLDTRLEVYRSNSARIPQTAGRVIPEPAYTKAEYEARILHPIYDAYAPFDPEGTLRHEWANARGAIARFTRGSIEVRVLDVQECPAADLAITCLIAAVLKHLACDQIGDRSAMREAEVERLHAILLQVIRDGDEALISDDGYMELLGLSPKPRQARDIWRELCDITLRRDPLWGQCEGPLTAIFNQGCLSRRILRALKGDVTPASIDRTWRELAGCLNENRVFLP